jgi:DNA-binding MarR family transcriptional regulator
MVKDLSLQEFLPYRLNNAAERISVALSRIYVSEFDVNIAEWRVLAALHERRAVLAKDIVNFTHMDKVRVSRAIKHLEEKGFVQRQTSQKDSRAAELSLTAKGRAIYKEIVPRALEWQNELLAPLSEIDKQELMRILTRLDSRVEEMSRRKVSKEK